MRENLLQTLVWEALGSLYLTSLHLLPLSPPTIFTWGSWGEGISWTILKECSSHLTRKVDLRLAWEAAPSHP